METEDPLKDLADIHLPDPVSFWPPALGWWLLAALVLALLTWLAVRALQRWRQARRLRAALRELDQVYRAYSEAADPSLDANAAGLKFLHGCNDVLKRVALLHYPAPQVAPLSGSAWLTFLDHHGGADAFSQGEGKVLGDGAYRRRFDGDPATLHALCRRWVRTQYHGIETTRVAA